MQAGTHAVIVGIFYIIAGTLFLIRNRSNVFDKGYGWFFFSVFHGIDEIADGLVELGIMSELKQFLEGIEFASFYLSSSFLLIATLVKINWIKGSEIPQIGFIVQLPVTLFFLLSNETLISAIETNEVTFVGVSILKFTVLFGLVPTLGLAMVYLVEFFDIQFRQQSSKMRKSRNLLLVALMLVLYNVGEIFAPINAYLLYLEVFALVVILAIPIELHLGTDKDIQLFMIYHRDGFLVHQTKLNSNLDDDTLVLVSGFMSAINSMVKDELDLGELEKIETGNGLLYLIHNNPFIYALLINSEDPNIMQRLHNISETIHPLIISKAEDVGMSFSPELRNKLESTVFEEFQ